MPITTALVVDDSKSARIMLSRMLQKLSLEVSMVESGEEAVELMANMASNAAPDVIFMDHMMPGMNGLETCQLITAKHSIPIYMYTSKESPEYEQEARAAGASGQLGKPAQLERLEQIISELNNRADDNQLVPTLEPVAEPATLAPVIETNSSEQATPDNEVSKVEEEERMSKEQIESIVQNAIDDYSTETVIPLSSALKDAKQEISDNQSEIRKLASRQASAVNMVTQPVLDATIKQHTSQFQTQLSTEVNSLKELIERSAELSADDLQKIKDVAIQSGALAGGEQGEKAATNAAEAVAAKVSAAQAQIQVEQDIAPLLKQVKSAKLTANIAICVAIAAIVASFIM